MKRQSVLLLSSALALVSSGATLLPALHTGGRNGSGTARSEGPCDIYAAAGAPCAAAHSTTRALYAGYNGRGIKCCAGPI